MSTEEELNALNERITDVLQEEARRAPELVFRAFEIHMEQQHRLTLLAAGMLGLVIPVLSSTGIVVAPWCLRRAIYLSATSVVLGVISNGIARASLPAVMRAAHQGLGQYARNVGFAQGMGDMAKIAAALSDGSDAMQREFQRRFTPVNLLHWLLEALQYLAFIVAAIYIARAF